MTSPARMTSHMRRLLGALEGGAEIDVERTMAIGYLSRRSAYRYLEALREARLVHVDRYERRGARYVPVYGLGRARGATVPKPENGAERQRAYRERHRTPRLSEIERALHAVGDQK